MGAMIELGQAGTSRSADILDMVRNFLGAWLVLSFHSKTSNNISRRSLHTIHSFLLVTFLVLSYEVPLFLYDSFNRYQDFSVLADLASSNHSKRFEGDSEFNWNPEGYLNVDFKISQHYSSIRMVKFPGDWSDYQHLLINLNNPSEKHLRISVKIYDWRHPPNYNYNDRFNKSFNLKPGETVLKIDLNDIQKAPRKRQMDLTNMHAVSLFVTRPKYKQQLQIKRIELID
jgi:hypothetical protein